MNDKNQQQEQPGRYSTLSRVDFVDYIPGLNTYVQVGGIGPTPGVERLRADYRNQVVEVMIMGQNVEVPFVRVNKLTKV